MKKKLRHYLCGQCHLENQKRAKNKGFMTSLLFRAAPLVCHFNSVASFVTYIPGIEHRRGV